MKDEVRGNLQLAYEQLLRLVEKEKQALTIDNLEELEECMRRKVVIVSALRKEGKDLNMPSECSDSVTALIEEIVAGQEHVKEGIQAMLSQCQNAILELRSAFRGYRAYHGVGKRIDDHSTRQL